LRIKPTKLRIKPTKLRIEPTKLRIEPTKLRIVPTKLRIELIKLRIAPTKLRIEPTKLRIERTKMCIERTKLRIERIRLSIYSLSLPLHQPLNKIYMLQKIGQLILSVCRRKQVPVASLAAHLNMRTESLYTILKKDDIKISRLRAISIFLQHNFFEDYHPSTQNPGDDPTPLYTENQRLKRKIALLEADLEWYHKNYGLPKIP
jgi:hypothetical protein